jgi:hypothetical protein
MSGKLTRNVLILAQQRQMEKDRERSSVSGQNNDLRDTAIKGLRCLVGTLSNRLVLAFLMDRKS